MKTCERRELIDPGDSTLSVSEQCRVARIARSSYYYRRAAALSQSDGEMLRRLDELYTLYPFFGQRKMMAMLRREGFEVGRKRVRKLFAMLGVQALAPGPRTSKPAPGHRIYPYLLRHREVLAPGEVWATDITYIRLARGFVYLVAHMDWFSRCVLSWRLSNTLDSLFCLDSLAEALGRFPAPKIHNSDQGSQFTSDVYTQALKDAGVAISMDGRGRWVDNVFVERLWRSVKHECVYMREFSSPRDAEERLGEYFCFYNQGRPHQSLGGATPWEVWTGGEIR